MCRWCDERPAGGSSDIRFCSSGCEGQYARALNSGRTKTKYSTNNAIVDEKEGDPPSAGGAEKD
jgi:hypothetical protein